MKRDEIGLPQSPAQAADPIRDGMLQALKKAQELVAALEALTFTAGDGSWVADIRGAIQKAIRDEAEYRAFLRGTLVPERAASFAARHPALSAEGSANAAAARLAAEEMRERAAPDWLANCCRCGRVVDTREADEGGDTHGAQLDDGRWTCSVSCWEVVTDGSFGPDGGREIDEVLVARFAADLHGMTPDDIEAAIAETQERIEEHEPWLEALCAQRRRMVRVTPLPPSSFPEDQEKAKAAATPTIADPDGESGR